MKHNDVERRVQAVRAISANPRLRRELLWLRAKEKGDEETACDLLRSEPGMRDWARQVEAGAQSLRSDADKAEWYGSLQDERFERAAELADYD